MSFLKNEAPASEIITMLHQMEHHPEADKLNLFLQQDFKKKPSGFLPILTKMMLLFGAALALIAFMFLLWELNLIRLSRFNAVTVLTGGVLYGAALVIGSFLFIRKKDGLEFLEISSFLFLLTGQLILTVMANEYWNHDWLSLLAWSLLSLVSYFGCRNSFARFFNLMVALIWFWILAVDSSSDYLMLGGTALNLAAILWMAFQKHKLQKIEDLYYPLVLSLLMSMAVMIFEYYERYQDFSGHWGSMILSILYISWFVMMMFGVCGKRKLLGNSLLIVSLLVAALMGLFYGAHLVVILGLVILGYGIGDRRLLLIGALAFPAFLFEYYYSLNVTLLYKSYYLMAGGTLLLVGAYLTHRQEAKHG